MNAPVAPVRPRKTRRCRWLSAHVRRFAIVLVALVVASLLLGSTASACPSCKNALGSHKGQGDWVGGFYWSILFMMSMPFALVGSFSGYMYYLVRRARQVTSAPPSIAPGTPTQPPRE